MTNTNRTPTEDWLQLYRGESKHVDYKGPMAWDETEKPGLMKDIIAMSNVRDGGRLVIGVSENRGTRSHEAVGLSDEQLATFDTTKVGDYVNGYVQPGVRVHVERHTFNGKQLIIIEISEFDRIPNICTRASPKGNFSPGDVLVRTDACQSQRIATGEQMRALLELAVSKTADALLRDFRLILQGGASQSGDRDAAQAAKLAAWDEEFEKLRNDLEGDAGQTAMFECISIPQGSVAGLESHEAIEHAFQLSKVALAYYPEFPDLRYGKTYRRAGFVEGVVDDINGYESRWRLYESGLFAAAHRVRGTKFSDLKPGKYMQFDWTCADVMAAFMVAGRLYAALGFDGEVELRLRWTGMFERKLVFRDYQLWRPEHYECREQQIAERFVLRSVDLRSGWEPAAIDMMVRICALFQVPGTVRKAVEDKFDNIRNGRT